MKTANDSHTAVLATRSEPLAMGLGALLLSIPPIQEVEHVADLDTLLAELDTAQPVLIILDTRLVSNDGAQLLQTVRAHSPGSVRVLLSKDMTEFRELVARSQDTVIIQGADPGRLARALEYLLSHSPGPEVGISIAETSAAAASISS
jgi:DNA-binding NarL/FixJ family response regulator